MLNFICQKKKNMNDKNVKIVFVLLNLIWAKYVYVRIVYFKRNARHVC